MPGKGELTTHHLSPCTNWDNSNDKGISPIDIGKTLTYVTKSQQKVPYVDVLKITRFLQYLNEKLNKFSNDTRIIQIEAPLLKI